VKGSRCYTGCLDTALRKDGQSKPSVIRRQGLRYCCVCAGCMAALQAEHFLQIHGAAEGDSAKVPTENGIAKSFENGVVLQNGHPAKENNPQLVAAL